MAQVAQVIVWTYAKLIELLENNTVALERAILTLDARQTTDERGYGVTRHENGRGWSQTDARFGGSLAEWIEKGMKTRREGGFGKAPGTCLTPKQREGALRMVRKYWRQLLEEIAQKGGAVDYKAPSPHKKDTKQRGSRPAPTYEEQEPPMVEDSRPPNGWYTREEAGFDPPEF